MLLPFALSWHFKFEGRARIRAYIKFNEWNAPTLGLDLYGCFGSMYWIRAGWCVSDIQREKKKANWKRKVYKFSHKMIYDSFESIYSSEAVLYCDRLKNPSTICLLKLSVKEDSGGSFSSAETCAILFASSLYPSYRTENTLYPVSFNVCQCTFIIVPLVRFC